MLVGCSRVIEVLMFPIEKEGKADGKSHPFRQADGQIGFSQEIESRDLPVVVWLDLPGLEIHLGDEHVVCRSGPAEFPVLGDVPEREVESHIPRGIHSFLSPRDEKAVGGAAAGRGRARADQKGQQGDARGRVGVADHDRSPAVPAGTDGGHQWHLGHQRDSEGVGRLLPAPGSEDVLVRAAVWADVVTHVLDHADRAHVRTLGHLSRPLGNLARRLLRRGDDEHRRSRHERGEGDRYVAGPGWQVA